jgi:hypothetical protein
MLTHPSADLLHLVHLVHLESGLGVKLTQPPGPTWHSSIVPLVFTLLSQEG